MTNNELKEVEKLFSEKEQYVDDITTMLEGMATIQFEDIPRPFFWFMVLHSAIKVLRENLSQTAFWETLRETANAYDKKQGKNENLNLN